MPRSPISLLGNRYGKLVVTSIVSRNQHGNSRWLCKCDCGGETEAMYQNLKLLKINSCGCIARGRKPKATPSSPEK
jgi:hypothetical protein